MATTKKAPQNESLSSQEVANNPVSEAWLQYTSGDYESARRSFEQALSQGIVSFNAHYGLGLTYKKLEKIDNAIEQFNLASSLLEKDKADENIGKVTILSNLIKAQLQALKK